VTFKNAVELKDVARRVPLERLLVETDAPYLAPVPFRGKRNEPAYVRQVAAHVAEIKQNTIQNIGEVTSCNFSTLFKVKL
jgi:TatD DNase family protein